MMKKRLSVTFWLTVSIVIVFFALVGVLSSILYEKYQGEDNNSEINDSGSVVVNNSTPPEVTFNCNDDIDNDLDGFIDFPSDFGCSSLEDDSETNNGGTECSDGIDNDNDNQIDQEDISCNSFTDVSEGNTAGGGGLGGGGSGSGGGGSGGGGSTPSCSLDSAQWNVTSASQGENVELSVTGTDCDGESVDFSVYLINDSGTDELLVQFSSISFSGSTASVSWVIPTLTGLESGGWFNFILPLLFVFSIVFLFILPKKNKRVRKLYFYLFILLAIFIVLLGMFLFPSRIGFEDRVLKTQTSLGPIILGNYYFNVVLSTDSSVNKQSAILGSLLTSECNDGIDNDGDGKIDYGFSSGKDDGCHSGFDNNEGVDVLNEINWSEFPEFHLSSKFSLNYMGIYINPDTTTQGVLAPLSHGFTNIIGKHTLSPSPADRLPNVTNTQPVDSRAVLWTGIANPPSEPWHFALSPWNNNLTLIRNAWTNQLSNYADQYPDSIGQEVPNVPIIFPDIEHHRGASGLNLTEEIKSILALKYNATLNISVPLEILALDNQSFIDAYRRNMSWLYYQPMKTFER